MAIHTIWFSIQLHTMGSCWMKNTRIPKSSKGKAFIPSRSSCWGFDKTQFSFSFTMTYWPCGYFLPVSILTDHSRWLNRNMWGRREHKYRASSTGITLKLINKSTEFLAFLFCFLGGFYFQKINLLSHWSCTEGREIIPFLSCSSFVSGIG